MEKPHVLRYFVPVFFFLAAGFSAYGLFTKQESLIPHVFMLVGYLGVGLIYSFDLYSRLKRVKGNKP